MNHAQRSFAGGEIDKSIYARTDLSRYQSAARQILNFIVRRQGGLENRAGSVKVKAVKDSTKTVRMVPFIFNDDQTYVLEFGEGYIRFVKNGVQLTVMGDPYEIVAPYEEEDLMDLRFVQSADVITITGHRYKPRELSRLGDTNWTLEVINFGASIGSVSNLSAAGGTAGGDSLYAVTAVDAVTGDEGLPAFFQLVGFVADETNPVTLTWDPLLGASSYKVYRSTDGVNYEIISSGSGIPVPHSATSWTDSNEQATDTVGGSWVPAAGQARIDVIAGGLNRPSDQRFTIKGLFTVSCDNSSAATGRLQAYYKRNTDGARVFAATIYSQGVVGEGVAGASFSEVFSANITVPDNGYTTCQIDIVPEVFGANMGMGDTVLCEVDFATAVGYKEVDWFTFGSGFIDDGSNGDPLQTPPVQRDLFNQDGSYPLAVGIYQQRKLYGNTVNDPEMNWASKTGAYRNFNVSRPVQDDDSLSWKSAGRQVNAVMHYLDMQKLIVFTNGSEMTVEGDDSGILRPDSINPRKFSANGCGSLPPLELADSALFVQARRNVIRDLVPLESKDSFSTTDLTLFAAHLFNGFTIVDWAYALAPHSIVWAVRSDGVLLGLTYVREQDVWAWHHHVTDGTIERVCTVPEGAENAVYIVVRRHINGEYVRIIERFASRFFTDVNDAVFMDCAHTYSGAPATVITGLDYLEGENVSVVADGIVKHNPNDNSLPIKTVSGGQITLAVAASKVHVGLPYVCDLETLDIDTPQGQSMKDRKMNISMVNLYVEESKKFLAGQDASSLYAAEESNRLTDVMSVNIDGDWNSNGRIFVRHRDPTPLTILAAIPQGSIG